MLPGYIYIYIFVLQVLVPGAKVSSSTHFSMLLLLTYYCHGHQESPERRKWLKPTRSCMGNPIRQKLIFN